MGIVVVSLVTNVTTANSEIRSKKGKENFFFHVMLIIFSTDLRRILHLVVTSAFLTFKKKMQILTQFRSSFTDVTIQIIQPIMLKFQHSVKHPANVVAIVHQPLMLPQHL